MTARIIDFKEVAAKVHEEVTAGVAEFKEQHGAIPGLTVVLVGDDPASLSYVKGKERACEKVGIATETILRDSSITQEELIWIVKRLNTDPAVNGILNCLYRSISMKTLLFMLSTQ